MSTVVQENLDERIERIRKLDAEIEKRHREAEADRLMALKDNAMVKTKSPNADDWPKGHKYDSIPFTYDQKDAELDNDDKTSRKNDKSGGGGATRSNRDYKKFADGEGPPPDPSYNFLADAARDGTTEKSVAEKKDWRSNSNGNTNNSNNSNSNNNNTIAARNKGGLNNSFRGRNNMNSGGGGNGNGKGGKPNNGSGSGSNNTANGNSNNNNNNNNNKYQRNNSANEERNIDSHSSWKTDRERADIDDISTSRNGNGRPMKNNDAGKWRREWDTNKYIENDLATIKPERNAFNGTAAAAAAAGAIHISTEYNQNQQDQKSPRTITRQISQITELPMEKRGNIMVSVSQDGEVKSVKLQSAKAIGTGRVGPRQQTKTQFSIQKEMLPTSPPLPASSDNNVFTNGNGKQFVHQQLIQSNVQQQQQQQQPQQFTYEQQQKMQFQQQFHQQLQLQQQPQHQNQQQQQQHQFQQNQSLKSQQKLQNLKQQQQQQQLQLQQSSFIINNHQDTTQFYGTEIPIITPRLFDGRPKLQDRLNRHRTNAVNLDLETKSTDPSSAAATAAPIISA